MPSSFLYDLWRTFFPAYLTAHEVGVEVVSHADGHACPLVEREGKNIRRRPPALVNQKVARYSAVLWYCIGLPA